MTNNNHNQISYTLYLYISFALIHFVRKDGNLVTETGCNDIISIIIAIIITIINHNSKHSNNSKRERERERERVIQKGLAIGALHRTSRL